MCYRNYKVGIWITEISLGLKQMLKDNEHKEKEVS